MNRQLSFSLSREECLLKIHIFTVFIALASILPATAEPIQLAQASTSTSPPEELGSKVLKDAVINPKNTALVFFRAGWCGPCRKIASNLVAVASLPVVEIDVDSNPSLARDYDLKNLPTVLLFSKGVPIDQKVGVISESELSAWVKKAVSGP